MFQEKELIGRKSNQIKERFINLTLINMPTGEIGRLPGAFGTELLEA